MNADDGQSEMLSFFLKFLPVDSLPSPGELESAIDEAVEVIERHIGRPLEDLGTDAERHGLFATVAALIVCSKLQPSRSPKDIRLLAAIELLEPLRKSFERVTN